MVAVDARGHGNSCDAQASDCRFDVAANDVIAAADHLRLPRFALGGISLGAGTAINITVRYPERVSALVLCRPAWLDRPQDPWNQQVYQTIADLLESGDTADAALEEFTRTPVYQQVLATAPAAAESLRHQITRPRAAANTAVLRGFPADRPTTSAATWAGITIPVLVIGHRNDPFHPYAIAETYARAIPRAGLLTVPSKDADNGQFAIQIRPASATSSESTRPAVTSTEREAGNAGPAAADAQAHSYVAVDLPLGGTQLRAALFTSSGAMTARWSVPTPGTGGSERVIEEVFRQITAAIPRPPCHPARSGSAASGTSIRTPAPSSTRRDSPASPACRSAPCSANDSRSRYQ